MYFIFMERSAHVLFLQSCAAAIESIREKSKHKFIPTRAETGKQTWNSLYNGASMLWEQWFPIQNISTQKLLWEH